MIMLDENFLESQRQLLQGMQDDEIIPFLLQRRRTTFFTLDMDFYQRRLCHARYCLVCVDVGQYEAAAFVRRLSALQAV